MDDVINQAGADGFSHPFTNITCRVPINPEVFGRRPNLKPSSSFGRAA
jgi:hypothetical protein